MAYIRRTAGRFSGSTIFRKTAFSALMSALAIAAFATESQAANWTGCHGAVAAGFTTVTTEPVAFGADGTQIGVAAGCDYQVDRFVLGAFASYDWKTFEVGASEIDATTLSFGARAGVLLNPDTLAAGVRVCGFGELATRPGISVSLAVRPTPGASHHAGAASFAGSTGLSPEQLRDEASAPETLQKRRKGARATPSATSARRIAPSSGPLV
jgi:hypothetical protein